MRFDDLPTELVVMISKQCDPFTINNLRMSNKQTNNIIDKHFQCETCLESLRLGMTTDVTSVSVTMCSVYGKRQERHRACRNSREVAEYLRDCLEKVAAVRRLHMEWIPISKDMCSVLMEEIEKIRYMYDFVLEDCPIEITRNSMSILVATMDLKCIKVIRCAGAHMIVDNNLIASASEEFTLEGLSEDYNITAKDVKRQIQEANNEMKKFLGVHHIQDDVCFEKTPVRLKELQDELCRLKELRIQIKTQDRIRIMQVDLGNKYMTPRIDPTARYRFITEKLLISFNNKPLPHFELRNLTAINIISMAAVAKLMRITMEKTNEVYWNFGKILIRSLWELQYVSSIPNIIWTPQPPWIDGSANICTNYTTFEMKTSDGKKNVYLRNKCELLSKQCLVLND